MRKLISLLAIVIVSCHTRNKNDLIGKWQLIKKSNDHAVIFEFNPQRDTKKYIYWFKDDSTLITQDDDGGNRQLNKYKMSIGKITLFDSLNLNTFYFKLADNKLSMKSIFSPFSLELKRMN
ncbi:MAG TPA: hypothetical protein VNT20_18825 [Flavisolibacter sp.]|jgi:hypothetical protein|nr:hypothetical protein [Flavisolibacter sp.]